MHEISTLFIAHCLSDQRERISCSDLLIPSRRQSHLHRLPKACCHTCAFLWLLQPRKGHLCAGNVLFRVFQILEQCFFFPDDPLSPVGVGVSVVADTACLATKEAVQIWAQLVRAAL